MSLLRSIALVLFTVSCSATLSAQEELDFIKFTTSEGLPSNFIGYVYADPDGFVWVSTARGLARFNGQQFVPVNEYNAPDPTSYFHHADDGERPKWQYKPMHGGDYPPRFDCSRGQMQKCY